MTTATRKLAWAAKRSAVKALDAQILALLEQGLRPTDVMTKLSVSCPRVSKARKRAGQVDARVKFSDAVKDEAVELRRQGLSKPEIAERTGISVQTLKELFADRGVVLEEKTLKTLLGAKYSMGDLREKAVEAGFACEPVVAEASLPHSVDLECFCGRAFKVYPYDVISGRRRSCGCLKSGPQNDLAALVRSWGFDVVENATSIIGRLQFDIFLPEQKVAIEYCGLHWHGQKLVVREHGELEGSARARRKHLDKLEACEAAGIRLITLFEDEWLTRREQVIGYLRATLGSALTRVGARKLLVRPVVSHEIRAFLEDNHLQGAVNGTAFALFGDAGPVAAAVFAARGKEWELTRYCVKAGFAVPGGLRRLLRQFRETHTGTIFSFSDRRWSSGGLYRRCGFRLDCDIPPSYWYFVAGKPVRHHKCRFRKRRIASTLGLLPGESEWSAMQRHGFDRVWDCGLTRWVLDP